MASSQVEIVSSSPFGCVLRDHNRRDHTNARAAHAAFQKNLKDLVQTHLHSCISATPRNSVSEPDEKSDGGRRHHQQEQQQTHLRHHDGNAEFWLRNGHRNNQRFRSDGNRYNANDELNNNGNGNSNDEDIIHNRNCPIKNIYSNRQSKVADRWARAREIIFTCDRQKHSPSPPPSRAPAQPDSPLEISHVHGVSSLVKKWRDFESCASHSPPLCCSRSCSGSSTISPENVSFVEVPPVPNAFSERAVDINYEASSACAPAPAPAPVPASTATEDFVVNWESDDISISATLSATTKGKDKDALERGRLKVADIIRKLTLSPADNTNKDRELVAVLNDSWSPRDQQQSEQRVSSISQVTKQRSPRLRGRQAFSDLLMRLECDRHRELESLAERKAVSRFSQRGRIQAFLRIRVLRLGADSQYKQHSDSRPSESNRQKLKQESSIMHLRKRFNTGLEHLAANSKCPHGKVTDTSSNVEKLISKKHTEYINNQQVTGSESFNKNASGQTVDVENLSENTSHYVVDTNMQHCTLQLQKSAGHHEEASVRSDRVFQGPSHEVSDLGSQKVALTKISVGGCKEKRSSDHHEDASLKSDIVCLVNGRKKNNIGLQKLTSPSGSVVEGDSNISQHHDLPLKKSADHHKEASVRLDINRPWTSHEISNLSDMVPPGSSHELSDLISQKLGMIKVSYGGQKVNENLELHEEASGRSDLVSQENGHELNNISSQISAGATISCSGCEVNSDEKVIANQQLVETRNEQATYHSWVKNDSKQQEVDNQHQQLVLTRHEQVTDWSHARNNWEEQEANNHHQQPVVTWNDQNDWEDQKDDDQHLIQNGYSWVSDVLHPQGELEEEQYSYQQPVKSNQGWTSNISRPRSDWEGLRKERYQEMLDPYLKNGDIRQLLERKSVSNFLSGNLRKQIDRLMICRTQGQQHSVGSQVEKEAQEVEMQQDGEMVGQGKEEEDEEKHENDDDYHIAEEDNNDDDNVVEEEECQLERQYNEVYDYADQTQSSLQSPSPSLMRPWSPNTDHEVSDDSQHAATPSVQQSPLSNSYMQESPRGSSFMNQPSTEMEMIYDLRGHMEQLRREMTDLRRSIKSCVSMQVKLQHSIKQEVAAAVSYAVGSNAKKRGPRKGSCCICCENKVDSLLYRCGHMCTCFNCAHQLHRNGKNCPICQAPILDIVRTHAGT